MASHIDGASENVAIAPEDAAEQAAPLNTSSPQYAAPPATPTPTADIVTALRDVNELDGLADHEYHWLATHCTERVAPDRAIVFRENEPALHMSIVLKGEIYVYRRNSGSINLFIGRTGQITGKLPFSRLTSWGAEGFCSGSLWVLDIHQDELPAMLRAIPSLAQICVSILLDRVRDFTRADLQAEKLVALGKLAANLSHELNNPASAAQRAAHSLSPKIDRIQELCALGRLFQSDEELANYLEWTTLSLEVINKKTPAQSSLSESDLEEKLINWLETHHVTAPWTVAPALARANLPVALLDDLASRITPSTLPSAITSFATTLDARSMVDAISDSSGRIFSIVSAIKDYSYMDQAPIQDVDLIQSVESTLTILHPRLQDMTVVRDYDSSLPTITAHGAELNQIWTALIENAVDATKGRGTLKVSVGLKGEMAFIEIWDDGVGIDPALSSRIFEPFFTTKPLGQGLGLGLDAVRRIVSKHFGSVSMQSAPNSTCFQVLLPLDQLQIY